MAQSDRRLTNDGPLPPEPSQPSRDVTLRVPPPTPYTTTPQTESGVLDTLRASYGASAEIERRLVRQATAMRLRDELDKMLSGPDQRSATGVLMGAWRGVIWRYAFVAIGYLSALIFLVTVVGVTYFNQIM